MNQVLVFLKFQPLMGIRFYLQYIYISGTNYNQKQQYMLGTVMSEFKQILQLNITIVSFNKCFNYELKYSYDVNIFFFKISKSIFIKDFEHLNLMKVKHLYVIYSVF